MRTPCAEPHWTTGADVLNAACRRAPGAALWPHHLPTAISVLFAGTEHELAAEWSTVWLPWACGFSCGVSAELLAEAVVWRGCRHGGQAIGAAKGLEYLKAGLEAEGRQAVRQLAAVAMPLPIPVTFPRVFREGLGADGDVVRSARCLAFERPGTERVAGTVCYPGTDSD